MKIVIITGGCINDSFVLEFLAKNKIDLTIAGDSGMEFFYRNKLQPDIIVGDFDSAKSEIVSFYRKKESIQIISFRPEKDETDTELALKVALEKKPKEIFVLGATGSRIDHMLGNIYLLQKALKKGVSCCIVDEHNRISLLKEKKMISANEQFGKYVSLLPLGDQVKGVTLKGFKYPLYEHTLTNDTSLGVSNELTEEIGSIDFSDGILIMIESKD